MDLNKFLTVEILFFYLLVGPLGLEPRTTPL